MSQQTDAIEVALVPHNLLIVYMERNHLMRGYIGKSIG